MSSRIIASIRRNAVAWLALFVALTGTSMAASHYVITSTKQIKPAVIKKLKGNRGAAGAQGATGPQGPQGATGSAGPQGPSGRGEKGSTGATGAKGAAGATGPEGGPAGPTGPTGEKGEKGEKGSTGATGEKGENASGGAKAWAHISASGASVTHANNIEKANVTALTGEEAGVYCIKGLGFAPENVQATIDGDEAEIPGAITTHLGKGVESSCPVGTQITIETFEPAIEEGKVLGKGEFEIFEETKATGFSVLIN
jgi:hypothetical protein